MRVLILVLLLSFLPLAALASDKCVTIDGEVYCQAQKEITLGGVKLKVDDPAELLRKAKQTKGNLKRTGLYDDYSYLPVIVELAEQNNMTYHELIHHMIEHWAADTRNPFLTIWDFELVYDDVPAQYQSIIIDQIADQVATDVEQAIYAAFGSEEMENV